MGLGLTKSVTPPQALIPPKGDHAASLYAILRHGVYAKRAKTNGAARDGGESEAQSKDEQ